MVVIMKLGFLNYSNNLLRHFVPLNLLLVPKIVVAQTSSEGEIASLRLQVFSEQAVLHVVPIHTSPLLSLTVNKHDICLRSHEVYHSELAPAPLCRVRDNAME